MTLHDPRSVASGPFLETLSSDATAEGGGRKKRTFPFDPSSLELEEPDTPKGREAQVLRARLSYEPEWVELFTGAAVAHRLLARLTHKQLVAFNLLCLGYTQRESAALMGVSQSTVSDHWRLIRRKLGTTPVTEAESPPSL